jgi:fibronectin-binding autotransporter adhesin
VGVAARLLAASPHYTLAQCVPAGPQIASGVTVTCSGTQSGRIGNGPNGAPADGNAVTVTVNDGATISTNNTNAISLGNNAIITVGSFSGTATATVTTYSTGGGGQYGTGNNTVEFNNNSTITIYKNGVVSATGTQTNSEAINPYGSGNTILKYGLIKAGASSSIYFENVNTTAASPRNTVDNYGTIDATGGTNPVTGGEAIGSFHDVGIDIINETGATIKGNLDLQGGNDTVTLKTQSVITGNLDGGGGTNALNLDAAAGDSDSLPGVVKNFQSLTKTGPGTWTLTGSVGQSSGAPLAMTVQAGTLVLTGNNTNFNGNVLIDPGATLEARAQSLPPLINDLAGDLLINQVSPDGIQPNDGTYAGVIQGNGIVTKIGVGTTTLTGANTYSGGTLINQGALAVGADSALGAATGPITFNGGGLQLLSSFNLSPSRAIALQAGGGTIDANGFQTTISQGITGPGALTVQDSTASTGTVILTGANVYAGGTTIASGTLQLGAGGTTGSIVGNVTDNGTLAFDRSDTVTFPGVISGTGGVRQIGTGTTVLNAVNPYSGQTHVNAGALAIGDASHPSAALTGGGAVGVLAGATFGGYGGVAGNVGSLGIVAVADAFPGFAGGPTGTFTIGGSFQNLGVAAIAGSGIGNVLAVKGGYIAGANAVVTIATLLNAGGPLSNQATDRLLVSGNARGVTSLDVRAFGEGALTTPDVPSAVHGISVVQVAGRRRSAPFR